MMMTETTTATKECTCHKFIRLHDGHCNVHGFMRRQQPSHGQPASATGSEWRADGDIHGGFVWQDGALLATTVEATRAHQIATDHNQHQQCAAQLRFLGNRAEELSSLLAGMTTERDGLQGENERLREALQLCKLDSEAAAISGNPIAHQRVQLANAALNHAEQGEGS